MAIADFFREHDFELSTQFYEELGPFYQHIAITSYTIKTYNYDLRWVLKNFNMK